jgi:putative DNA primase/helicase
MSILTQEEAFRLLTNFNCCFIHIGEKRPIGSNWQHNPRKIAEWRDQGVGVICGRIGDIAIQALDFDTSNAELSSACIIWLKDYLCNHEGTALIRVGMHPKFLIPFVIDEPIRKSEFTSKRFYPKGVEQIKEHSNQLEVLGVNNQFVAYHIHPDTRKPYQWLALIDGEHETLHEISPCQLLKLTRDDLTTIRTEFEMMARTHGLKEKESEKGLAPIEEVIKGDFGYTLEEVLPYLKNEDVDYDDWVKVGAAIKTAGGQFSDWIDYSVKSSKHNPEEMAKKWSSFTNKLGGVGIGTLVMLAKQNGLPSKSGIAPQRPFDLILCDAQKMNPSTQPGAIEALVHEAAKLKAAERGHILHVIKTSTGKTQSYLNHILREYNEINRAEDDPDELTLAQRVIQEIGVNDIICAMNAVWRWDDLGVWRKLDDRTVSQIVQTRLAGSVGEVTSRLVSAVTDLVKTAIHKPLHEFNIGEPDTVNCRNGELVLGNGVWRLTPHCRDNYRTTQIPVIYDPDAEAPLFKRFLEQIFHDDPDAAEKSQALLEMMGYTLMAHCRYERFVILVGSGANGKSVFLAILEALCGTQSVAGVQPSKFGSPFQRAHLHLKLANIVTEIKQGEVIDDASLKSIVSGEPTTVEHKHKDPFVMRPFSTCWFGTNHMPHTRDFSEALFRRALVIRFNQVFKPERGNHDPELKDKLITELPGIFNLALNAYARAVQARFTEPASAEEARSDWRLEADQVSQFVAEECVRDPHFELPIRDLYQNYRCWADQNGIYNKLTMKSFRDRLTQLGFGKDRTNGCRLVTGLRVRFFE